jgi:hypothetical protein
VALKRGCDAFHQQSQGLSLKRAGSGSFKLDVTPVIYLTAQVPKVSPRSQRSALDTLVSAATLRFTGFASRPIPGRA